MVALNNVAQAPFVAHAEVMLQRCSALVRRVPLRFWRMGAMALVLFWICHSLAGLFWYLVPAPALPVAPVTPVVRSLDAGPARSIDVAAVQALHLFGDFHAQPVVQAPPPEPERRVELTRLNLELQGVIAANDPEKSWAIIGSANDQSLYKIGDEIRGARGVKIAEIYELRIILNNNGNLEELWLYGEDGMRVASSAPPPRPPPVSRPAEPGPVQAQVSRDQVEQVRNIGDVVRFMVATEDGRMVGYRVRPGRQRELFDQVGLRNDDIVISVNGIEVNEPQKVREVYQALRTATEANLLVLRDGSTHSIQISMSSEG